MCFQGFHYRNAVSDRGLRSSKAWECDQLFLFAGVAAGALQTAAGATECAYQVVIKNVAVNAVNITTITLNNAETTSTATGSHQSAIDVLLTECPSESAHIQLLSRRAQAAINTTKCPKRSINRIIILVS